MTFSNPSLHFALRNKRFQFASTQHHTAENWLDGDHRSVDLTASALADLQTLKSRKNALCALPWRWPERPVVFIADPHADAQAFEASLVASGTIDSITDSTIVLNTFGQQALFIIGGDCLDKGPSNLALLDAIKKLKNAGAHLKLLAGNHDVRLLMGLKCLQQTDNVLSSHMFLRMGAKIVPLLHEVYLKHAAHKLSRENLPSTQQCEDYLFPGNAWFEAFPHAASFKMSDRSIKKEVKRLKQKIEEFKSAALNLGMDMQALYATTKECEQLFLNEDGEYAWFFKSMQLAHRENSFLFVHAGLDDEIAYLVANSGVQQLNALYKKQSQHDIFEFYYGAVANTLRTKYRADDEFRLSHHGVRKLHEAGIHAIVHGHQNRHHGQRIVLRENLAHFECDTTLDCHSRKKEGLSGYGFAATLFLPEGKALGISSDYTFRKCFDPSYHLETSRL